MRLPRLAARLAYLVFLLAATCANAQVSTQGTDFWACDMENTEGGVNEPFGTLVADSGTSDAFVTIEGSDGVQRPDFPTDCGPLP